MSSCTIWTVLKTSLSFVTAAVSSVIQKFLNVMGPIHWTRIKIIKSHGKVGALGVCPPMGRSRTTHIHTGCICLTFLHCVFSNEPSKRLDQSMHIHTDCIFLTFLHYAFSNESSNCLPERMHNHTGCICSIFLRCGFSNVFSKHLHKRIQSYTGCICSTFLHCAFSNVSSICLSERMHIHIGCICLIFPYVHWQPFHWKSSAWNHHAEDFVPFSPGGKLCSLLLMFWNWEI